MKPGELPPKDLGIAQFSKIITEDAPPTPPHPELGDIVLGMPYVKRYVSCFPLYASHSTANIVPHAFNETRTQFAILPTTFSVEDDSLFGFSWRLIMNPSIRALICTNVAIADANFEAPFGHGTCDKHTVIRSYV